MHWNNNEFNLNTDQKIKRLASTYHILPSIFWSAINFTPITIYCYTMVNHSFFYWILSISFFTYLLPTTFLDLIQLSNHTKFYKKIGVTFIKKFTQEGDFINRLIKKKYPQYSVIKNRALMSKYLQKTYHFERFHLQLFVLFLSTATYALIEKDYKWAILITFNNVIFNVYPNLLQQYNRLRLKMVI